MSPGKIIGNRTRARRHRATHRRIDYIPSPDVFPMMEPHLKIGMDRLSELIGLYDVIVRLMSLALQYNTRLKKVSDLLAGAKFEPCSPVSRHDRLKHCSSVPDLIGRHLLIEYCGRDDLAHVVRAAETVGTN